MRNLNCKRVTGYSVVTVVAALTMASAAEAQQPSSDGCSDPSFKPSAANVEEARTRYERGVQLYSDGDYKLALIEFNRSYEVACNDRVLYNIAQVNFQLNKYADALVAFERYLADTKDISAARRAEVLKEIDGLKARTAHLLITSSEEGAEIVIDGSPKGTTPLDGRLLVDAGELRITLTKRGRESSTKMITLAGGDDQTINIDLAELPAGTIIQAGPVAGPGPDKPTTHRETPDEVWIGWAITGALTAGAITTGILSLGKSGELDDLRGDKDIDRTTYENLQADARGLAIATDVLIASAVIAGGVSLYFTIRGVEVSDSAALEEGDVRVGVRPGGVTLNGAF